MNTQAASDPLPPVPDFDVYAPTESLTGATTDGTVVTLVWSDGVTSQFHGIFLRDHAMEPGTYNMETRESLCEVDSYPADLSVAEAAIDAGGALTLTFKPENLTSRFHPGWLRAHDYSNLPRPDPADIRPELWCGADLGAPPSFDGRDILEDDDVLAAWLGAIARYGIARLTDVATEPGMVRKVVERIGPIRVSNFGDVFEVKAKVDPDSNAYTGLPLFPHTDLSTREYEPGLQFLHCLENTTQGGLATYIDGYRVVDDIRRFDADIFDALASIPWTFANRARNTDYRFRSPIVVLGPDGDYRELRLTGFLRAPLEVSFADVPRAYASFRHLSARLRDPQYAVAFAYRPGDLVGFDNRRVLHGRSAFDPAAGHRWLQGCYCEREELLSRIRVLDRQERALRMAAL